LFVCLFVCLFQLICPRSYPSNKIKYLFIGLSAVSLFVAGFIAIFLPTVTIFHCRCFFFYLFVCLSGLVLRCFVVFSFCLLCLFRLLLSQLVSIFSLANHVFCVVNCQYPMHLSTTKN
jgi:hypothetical protein